MSQQQVIKVKITEWITLLFFLYLLFLRVNSSHGQQCELKSSSLSQDRIQSRTLITWKFNWEPKYTNWTKGLHRSRVQTGCLHTFNWIFFLQDVACKKGMMSRFLKKRNTITINRKIERVVHYIELIYSYFLHSLKWITRIDCQTDKLRVQQRCTWLRYATLNTIYRYYLYVSHTCQNFPETSKQSTIRQKFFRIFFFPNNGRCVTVRINEAIKICIELI